MDTSWANPLISGLSGVGGAAVGAGALMWVSHRSERGQNEQERRTAWVGFYAAANSFALMYHTWSTLQPGKGRVAEVRFGIRMFGYTRMILERLWRVTDRFWEASGRARSVATAEERAVIDGIESVIGDWKMGEPIPDAFGPAVRRLRALMERRGVVVEEPVESSEDVRPAGE